MTLNALTTIAHLEKFLTGSQPIAFAVLGTKDECFQWIQTSWFTFEYLTLSMSHKDIVTRYLLKVRGYSRQQFTRLIYQYCQTGPRAHDSELLWNYL